MRYKDYSIEELLPILLSKGKEGDFWDFKQEWHENTQDLIKDVICFANTVHDEDCYLIFGVADDLTVTGMIKPRKKQADILDALSNLMFAGDNIPLIEVEAITYQDKDLDVLRIFDTDKTPIYLKKPYGKMAKGCIYARVGDRNTPDQGNAEIGVIENLWKKRFGLTKPPLDYIFDSLHNKLEWTERENGFYNIYKPEYTIERFNEDDYDAGRGSDEFYSYAQTNESTSYYFLDVKANGTVLERFQIVNLDSGRLSVPVPEWGFIHMDPYGHDVIGYKAYIKDSHSEVLMRFMYDPNNGDQRWAFANLERVTLFFDTESERLCFEEYVTYNLSDFKRRVEASEEYDYIATGSDLKTIGYKRSLRAALVLKEMLNEFREFNRSTTL